MLQLIFQPFPTFETERLIMRKVSIDDANDLFELRRNVEAMKYIHKPPAQTIDEAILLINKIETALIQNEGIAWGVIDKKTGRLIGHLGYHRIDKENHRAEIGYMISPTYWKKGIMTEAIAPIINFGFNQLNFHSIEANINPANEGSKKLLENFKFKKEGYLKEDYFFEGKFYDTEIYSLLTNK